jgi:DNA polymerase/3'-5' exonuclease PolX
MEKLSEIYGIGPKKAKEIIESFDDVYEFLNRPHIYEKLSEATKIYIKHKPLFRFPAKRIKKYQKKVEALGGLICGSYRRGADYCGDIDIMLPPEARENINKIGNFTAPPFAAGPELIRTFLKIAPEVYIRADIYFASPEAWHFMLLYLTGSRQFNIYMRSIAAHKKYTLNQLGIFKDRKSQLLAKSEKDIFDFLQMKYLEPNQRSF